MGAKLSHIGAVTFRARQSPDRFHVRRKPWISAWCWSLERVDMTRIRSFRGHLVLALRTTAKG